MWPVKMVAVHFTCSAYHLVLSWCFIMYSIHGYLHYNHRLFTLLTIVLFSRTLWLKQLPPPLVIVSTSFHHICQHPDLPKLIALLLRKAEWLVCQLRAFKWYTESPQKFCFCTYHQIYPNPDTGNTGNTKTVNSEDQLIFILRWF